MIAGRGRSRRGWRRVAARRDAAVAGPGAARPALPRLARASARNPLALLGLVHRARARPDRGSSRRCSPPLRPIAAGPRTSACCRRAPRTGSAPTSSAATSSPASSTARASRSTIVALVAVIVAADRPPGRHRRRLSRRLGRHGADAHHRHLPRLPAAHPGARLRRRARPRHRERHHRHRAHRLAALCARRPRRDADRPPAPTTSPRCGCRAPRPCASSCATSCRSASPR